MSTKNTYNFIDKSRNGKPVEYPEQGYCIRQSGKRGYYLQICLLNPFQFLPEPKKDIGTNLLKICDIGKQSPFTVTAEDDFLTAYCRGMRVQYKERGDKLKYIIHKFHVNFANKAMPEISEIQLKFPHTIDAQRYTTTEYSEFMRSQTPSKERELEHKRAKTFLEWAQTNKDMKKKYDGFSDQIRDKQDADQIIWAAGYMLRRSIAQTAVGKDLIVFADSRRSQGQLILQDTVAITDRIHAIPYTDPLNDPKTWINNMQTLLELYPNETQLKYRAMNREEMTMMGEVLDLCHKTYRLTA